MKKLLLIIPSIFAIPFVAFAQQPTLAPLRIFLASVSDLIAIAVPLLIGLAVVAFFYGLVRYIFGGAAKGSAEGRSIMIWGLVALFVMVSVWGIIVLAQGAFGVQGTSTPSFPRVPGVNFSN